MSAEPLDPGTAARRRRKRLRHLRIKLEDSPVFRSGVELRDEGMQRVLNNEKAEWKAAYYEIVSSLPYGKRMRGEQINALVRELIGEPHHPNTWGAVTPPCIRRGWLKADGDSKMKKASSHARKTDVYITGWHKRPPD